MKLSVIAIVVIAIGSVSLLMPFLELCLGVLQRRQQRSLDPEAYMRGVYNMSDEQYARIVGEPVNAVPNVRAPPLQRKPNTANSTFYPGPAKCTKPAIENIKKGVKERKRELQTDKNLPNFYY